MESKLFHACLFDELENLYPDTDPAGGTHTLHVHAANGTYPGAHILLTDLEPGQFLTFEVSGPYDKYKFFEMIPVPVEVNSGANTRTEWWLTKRKNAIDHNSSLPRRAPFAIYDALKPISNVAMVNGCVMAFAFRVQIDTDKRNVHQWTIRIRQRDMIRELMLVVDVYPETVGAASKDDPLYVNWIHPESITEEYNAPLFSDRWYSLFEDYLRVARYGRQNVVSMHPDLYLEALPDHGVRLNEGKLDRLMEIVGRVGYHWMEGGQWCVRRDGVWDAEEGECIYTGRPFSKGGMEDVLSIAGQMYAYLKKHDLTDRWLQSFLDEPVDSFAQAYCDAVAQLKAVMPGVKILEATIARESIVGSVDYWCPTPDEYERYRPFFDERVKAGDRVMVYTCLNPVGNYCNRLLDMERIRTVYLGWGPAKYENICGFLHWGGNYCEKMDAYYFMLPTNHVSEYTPFVRPTVLPAGDNIIIYPGKKGPIPSVRLEAQRIGFEDLALLNRLKAKNRPLADEIIESVFHGYDDYEKSIAAYRSAKKRLLDAL